jgi:hypothetical protein
VLTVKVPNRRSVDTYALWSGLRCGLETRWSKSRYSMRSSIRSRWSKVPLFDALCDPVSDPVFNSFSAGAKFRCLIQSPIQSSIRSPLEKVPLFDLVSDPLPNSLFGSIWSSVHSPSALLSSLRSGRRCAFPLEPSPAIRSSPLE